MNTARIVVLTIAVGAGGALACPDTVTRGTGLIAQARRTSAQLPTLRLPTATALPDALRASPSRHGTPIPATMRN